MEFTITKVIEHKYLLLTMTGDANLEQLIQAQSEIESTLADLGWNRLLVDISQMTSKLSITQDYEFTKSFAPTIPGKRKTATITSPDMVEDFHFHENVAQNRGINLKVFADRQQALDWLLE